MEEAVLVERRVPPFDLSRTREAVAAEGGRFKSEGSKSSSDTAPPPFGLVVEGSVV